MPNLELPIEDAIVNSLVKFLGAQLAPVPVIPRWPNPDAPLPDCVTVIMAGDAEEEMHDPYVVSSTTVSATHKEYLWALAGLNLPLQVDCWATSAAMRGHLAKKVREYFKSGSIFALADDFGDAIGNDLELALEDGYETQFASFIADSPDMSDTADAVQRSEFRARFSVDARSTLTVKALSPRMATIRFRLRSGKTLPTSGDYAVTTTTTSSGTTWTKNTP